MKGFELLHLFTGYWPTNKGEWIPGKKVYFREKSLLDDFSERSWITLFLYGINGRLLSERESKIVEKIWSLSSSFPDPRLWNNRVSALAGTTRSTGSLAISGSTAVTEAKIYGSRPVYLGARFLQKIKGYGKDKKKVENYIITTLKTKRALPGFGRPVTTEDERINPLLLEFSKLGYESGEHLDLIKVVKDILQEKKYRLKPNIAIYCSAAFSDLGFNPYECYLLAVLAFSAGMFPCFIDALEKPEGMLFPLNCADINYSGPTKRSFDQ